MAKTELNVVVKTRELTNYILHITTSSPKKYRFTLSDRMINLSLDVIEAIYLANEVFIRNEQDYKRLELRMQYFKKALTKLKLLSTVAMLSRDNGCILPKQFEKISSSIYHISNMLGKMLQNDVRRSNSMGLK